MGCFECGKMRVGRLLTTEERNSLLEHYLPLIKRIAFGLVSRGVPPCVSVDDMVQDAALKLLPELEKYQPKNGATLTTYLHWVIRRDLIDSMRRQLRRDRYSLSEVPCEMVTWPISIGRNDMKKVLTSKQLQAVELVYLYGFTQKLAAEKLGIYPPQIRSRLSRAIVRLRKFYEKSS